MSIAQRNRIFFIALFLLISQLALLVHATVHDLEPSCQLCLTQAHSSTGILPAKIVVPTSSATELLVTRDSIPQALSSQPRAFLQRAPPVIS